MIEYHKSFLNKDNNYPSRVPDVIDVMHQRPEKKGKHKFPLLKNVECLTKKEEETASSYA